MRGQEIAELIRDGLTLRAIGERFGVSKQRVHQVLRRSGLSVWEFRQRKILRLPSGRRNWRLPPGVISARKLERQRRKLLRQRMQFWEKVEGHGPTSCWQWVGFVNPQTGYGQHRFSSLAETTHRCAWVYTHELVIPRGQHVAHTCDNKVCANPVHLYLASAKENARDRDVAMGRRVEERGVTDFQLPPAPC